MFRSDQLAWDVITRLALYKAPGFMGSFPRKFPNFNPARPGSDASAWLLDEFQRDLTVQTIPRTLVLQIRFRSRDAALSAAVVNALIAAYRRRDTDARVEATKDATTWLNAQLGELKMRADDDERKLSEFQKAARNSGYPGDAGKWPAERRGAHHGTGRSGRIEQGTGECND